MAAITSTGSGAWNSTTPNAPWPSGVVPVSGDTVTIATGHTVNVPNGYTATVGTSVASGTNAILLQGTATLNVDTGGILYARGDITQQRSSTLALSGTMYFDSNNASYKYVWKSSTTGSGAITATVSGGTVNGAGGRSGGNGYINFGGDSLSGYVKFTVTNATLKNLGDASQANNVWGNNGTATTAWCLFTNVLLDTCGQWYMRNLTADYNLTWQQVDIRNSSSTTPIYVYGSSDPTTGYRMFDRVTNYASSNKTMQFYTGGVVVKDSVFGNTLISANHASTKNFLLTRSMVIDSLTLPSSVVAVLGQSNNQVKNTLMLYRGDNQHYISESGSTLISKNIYDNNLFDGDAYVGSDYGDGIVYQYGACDITNNVMYNRAGCLATTGSSGSTGTPVNIKNNTVYGPDVNLLNNGEATSGLASQIGSVVDNLIVGGSVGGTNVAGVRQMGSFVQQTIMTMDYNASYNEPATSYNSIPMKTYPVGHPYAGKRAYVAEEKGLPWISGHTFGDNGYGLHDIAEVNPAFLDTTRTIAGYFGYGTNQVDSVIKKAITINGRDYSGASVTPLGVTATYVIEYVKSGFTPTNSLFATAGSTGGVIGAFVPVSVGWSRSRMMSGVSRGRMLE